MHESNVAEKLYQKRGASCLLLIKMAFLSVSVIAVWATVATKAVVDTGESEEFTVQRS